MGTIAIYFVIIAMIFASAESMNRGDFIPITEAPYFVSFVATKQHKSYCGGAIISEYWILTAAHCLTIFRMLPWAESIEVRTGSTINDSTGDIHEVEKAFVYRNYESRVYLSEAAVGRNDIALYKLKTPIKFNEYKQPIKVNSQLPNDMDKVTILGIGNEGPKKFSKSLKAANVKAIPKNQMKIRKEHTPEVLYIADLVTEACPGDSGSPVVYNGELIGVLVGTLACREWNPDSPIKAAVITRADKFYDWIMQQTNIKY